jgi:5-hydroxyisourate hydrolase-like protein (transthyretin family)
MFFSKAKIAVIALLATSLLAACGFALAASGDEKKPSADAKPQAVTKPQAAEEAQTIQATGRVLDLDGKPVAGAKVYLLDESPAKEPPKVRATTDDEGRFQFTVAQTDVKRIYGLTNAWAAVFQFTTADGYGLAMDQVKKPEPKLERTLRLVKDQLVQGRVLDLQGQPVAGAKIQVNHLSVPNSGDLTAFLDDLKGRPDGYPAENSCLTTAHNPALVHFFPEVISGKDGRFRIIGLGRERVAGLTISGPTIESKQVRVRTRPGETISRMEWKDFPGTGTLTYYGATFEHAAGPTRPIEGVVLDKETGKPVGFAVVESVKLAGDDLHGRNFIRTTADRDGRYRLVGMPKGEGNLIQAQPPEDQPYLPVTKGVDNAAGLEAAHVDFELLRGVLVKGKVMEKGSDKPVSANLEYFVFPENPALKRYPQGSLHHRLYTDNNGTFQFVGVPGRSLVAARGDGDRWAIGIGAEKYEKRDATGHLQTSPPCLAIGFHTLVEINAAEDAKSVDCKIVLDPGRTVKGTVLGPDDRPLAGARICGVKSYAFTYWEGEPLATAEFTALGVLPTRPRRMLFLHEGKHLAGSLMVRGDEKSPPVVKLEPWGVVTGKLVAESGQPSAGADLRFMFGGTFDDPVDGSHPTREFPVDKDGAFRLEGMVPGLKYHLAVMQKGRITGWLFKNQVFKAGETKDLGEVQAKN